MSITNPQGTEGRVYGGDCELIHIKDGTRAEMGQRLAQYLDDQMRLDAIRNQARSVADAMEQALCPGCYMVAIFDCALSLARENGQELKELGRSLGQAFLDLARQSVAGSEGTGYIEEIQVVLDGSY